MNYSVDLAIIGSGFGGSLLGMIARRIGLSVAMIEKHSHPRFAIGESTSPLANLIIEQLADRYDLPRLKPLAQYGDWKRTYPEIVCGLKRGFTYFKHEERKDYTRLENRANQLMVAASPDDESADTHWLRSDVDHFFVREAIALGVVYLDQTSLFQFDPGATILRGERNGEKIEIRARLVIDAGGPRGFLSDQLKIAETPFRGYPQTRSLYSHFLNVERCDGMIDYRVDEEPPYPVDDAAVHHVFDGGWMWVLRFDNRVTSAGIAVTDDLAENLNLSEGEPAWHRFLSRYPTIAKQFAGAVAIREFTYQPRLSYRAEAAAGSNWALLPSAAAFIDPLFSTGIPLTLLGIERLGRILERDHASLREYADITLFEADRTAEFIAACYRSFPKFELFSAYSMFYFAAASFSEMARRLDRSNLVRRFMASDHPQFGRAMREWGLRLEPHSLPAIDVEAFRRATTNEMDCLNIAGLCDPAKNNWYGVDLNDLIVGAGKLGMSQSEMAKTLKRASWARKKV